MFQKSIFKKLYQKNNHLSNKEVVVNADYLVDEVVKALVEDLVKAKKFTMKMEPQVEVTNTKVKVAVFKEEVEVPNSVNIATIQKTIYQKIILIIQ